MFTVNLRQCFFISSLAWKKLCCNSTNAPWNLFILLKWKRLLPTFIVPFPFILASNGHLKFAPKLNNITLLAERTWKESQIWNDFEIISTVNLGYKHPLLQPPQPPNSVSSGSPIQFNYSNYHNYQLSTFTIITNSIQLSQEELDTMLKDDSDAIYR